MNPVRQHIPSKPALVPARARSSLLQRQCAYGNHATGGECEACKRNGQTMQRASLFPQHKENEGEREAPSIVRDVLRSPGHELDPTTRTSMEARFSKLQSPAAAALSTVSQGKLTVAPVTDPLERQADTLAARTLQPLSADGPSPWSFSHVRVHTDSQAAESARAMNALAYTVGQHIVFGTGRFAPTSREGQHLLAHELAHTVQGQGAGIVRRAEAAEAKPKPPGTTLPPRKPAPAPAPRTTDVPPGVMPCWSGSICVPPVRGSAWDFGKKAEKESTARPKTPLPAKEVKKAAEASSPGVLKEIFEVTVNPGLSPNVAAQVDTCKEFNVSAPDPSASCIEVPKHLEDEAARFNQGKHCLDLSVSESDPMCYPDRNLWQLFFIETMTHEAAHVTFKRRTPVGISSRTRNEITLHELSELDAQLSEFPVHYRMIRALVSGYKDAKKAQETFETSVKAWVTMHVESEGEGIRGMLTKLRCINECDKVAALITALVGSVTATWPDEMKNALLQALSDANKLDWPLPAPNLRPAPPERPKAQPLYQPRKAFIPEIEKSLENLP
jgi:Domain of unknown function (DUF4157)